MPEDEKGAMSTAEAGQKGGEKTAATHGREFYQEIGKKGGQATHMNEPVEEPKVPVPEQK